MTLLRTIDILSFTPDADFAALGVDPDFPSVTLSAKRRVIMRFLDDQGDVVPPEDSVVTLQPVIDYSGTLRNHNSGSVSCAAIGYLNDMEHSEVYMRVSDIENAPDFAETLEILAV